MSTVDFTAEFAVEMEGVASFSLCAVEVSVENIVGAPADSSLLFFLSLSAAWAWLPLRVSFLTKVAGGCQCSLACPWGEEGL